MFFFIPKKLELDVVEQRNRDRKSERETERDKESSPTSLTTLIFKWQDRKSVKRSFSKCSKAMHGLIFTWEFAQ